MSNVHMIQACLVPFYPGKTWFARVDLVRRGSVRAPCRRDFVRVFTSFILLKHAPVWALQGSTVYMVSKHGCLDRNDDPNDSNCTEKIRRKLELSFLHFIRSFYELNLNERNSINCGLSFVECVETLALCFLDFFP